MFTFLGYVDADAVGSAVASFFDDNAIAQCYVNIVQAIKDCSHPVIVAAITLAFVAIGVLAIMSMFKSVIGISRTRRSNGDSEIDMEDFEDDDED